MTFEITYFANEKVHSVRASWRQTHLSGRRSEQERGPDQGSRHGPETGDGHRSGTLQTNTRTNNKQWTDYSLKLTKRFV